MSPAQQGHCTANVQHEAVGAIAAQTIVAAIREGSLSADHGWLRFIELGVAAHDWRSASCRAFVRELCKLAAR